MSRFDLIINTIGAVAYVIVLVALLDYGWWWGLAGGIILFGFLSFFDYTGIT